MHGCIAKKKYVTHKWNASDYVQEHEKAASEGDYFIEFSTILFAINFLIIAVAVYETLFDDGN